VIGVATGQTAHLRLHQTPTDPYTVGKLAVTSLQACTRPPHTRTQKREKHIDARTFFSAPEPAGCGRLVAQSATCAAPRELPKTPGGAPQPPAVSRRAAAPPQPPLPPPRSSRLPRSHRLQPAGEREEHRIVENDDDGRREDARHLGLDGGG
jgi:hypothetical protein